MASSSSTALDAVKKEKSGSKTPKGSTAPAPPQVWESRAVVKLIEAGSAAECPHCQERVKFRARHRDQQVICNVYKGGAWQRVEQFHLECYTEAEFPHGEPVKG
ncbi:MAG: hypothetical protein ACRBK7_15260 [Acidimicrobiales bacterium]